MQLIMPDCNNRFFFCLWEVPLFHFMTVLKVYLAAAAAVWASFCIGFKECKFTAFGKVAFDHFMFSARMLGEETKFLSIYHIKIRISRR